MRFYTKQPPFACGIDWPARSLYVWVLSHEGEMLRHRHRKAAPEPLLQAVAPDRDGLVGAVEGIFTWSWLADLCAEAGRPCVLGQALSRKAIHGGKAQNDKSDSPTMAPLRRGGLLPQAAGSPAERRATRALLRRRTHLRRQGAALLAHVQKTNAPYNWPEMGQKSA